MKAAVTAQEVKQPKTIAVREVVPWLIVIFMMASVAGVITGWFIRSNVAAETQHQVALVSKEVRR